MNINQLEYFVTTVRCGSYSLAARELFVAPQTVAKAVNDLERELNVSLCRRSSRSIEPTPFGQVFSTRASEILYRLTDLESLAKRQTLSQTEEGVAMLAVAYSPHRGNAISPSDFAPFDREHPRIRLSRTYRPSGACLAALEEGVVDAAIVAGRTMRPNIVCTRLLSFPLSLAISRNHPLARQDSIDFEDLQGTPVAEPEDLRYCHNVIADRLSRSSPPSLLMPRTIDGFSMRSAVRSSSSTIPPSPRSTPRRSQSPWPPKTPCPFRCARHTRRTTRTACCPPSKAI